MDIHSFKGRICDVGFLPIVSAFVNRIGVIEEVNRICPGESDVSTGHVVLALILDTLTGRTPLYRLERSFEKMDLELLLGKDIPASKLNDDAVGRVLDRLHEVGTGKILGTVAMRAVKMFELDTSRVHHDTTSVNVSGDYDLYKDPDHEHPFEITYGFSKAHRFDLKQLVHSLLCVDHGIPIYSKYENGNASDKVINKNLMGRIVDKMRELGEKTFLVVVDSAGVTKENLILCSTPETWFFLLSRLPASYKECGAAISRAVDQDQWEDLGVLSQQSPTPARPSAHYKAFETTVTLYGIQFRALVVHSSAHDKRKTKKLERMLEQDLGNMNQAKADQEKIEYACLPDAKAAILRLPKGKYHRLSATVQESPKYGRGRPKKDGTKNLIGTLYRLQIEIKRREQAISKAEKEAGCFVLLTNVPVEGENGVGSRDLLAAYKAQDTIERNFGFLKDDLIVNSLFLKTPARIEALGLILVLTLMVWRLMERTMRASLSQRGATVTGWDKRQTARPTSFMMTTHFSSVIVIRADSGRFLSDPLSTVQLAYVKALGLPPEVFVGLDKTCPNRSALSLKSWETSG